MKICFISTMASHRWGGSEDLWAVTAKYALQQKHEVLISVPDGKTLHKEYDALKNLGAKIYLRQEHDTSGAVEKALYKLKRTISGIPPVPQFYYDFTQAVNAFNPDFICISGGGVFNVVESREVVWLVSQMKCPYFLIGHSNLEHKVYPYPYIQRIRELYKGAKRVYFISNRNLEVAKRQVASPGFTNYVVVKNPCKFADRTIIPYPDDITEVQFAMVGRLQCRNKGNDILFQALASDKWRSRKWKLNLYGTGEDLDYLRDLAAYFNISGNVIFHGWVGDVAEIWKKNHLMLMPSIEEGTPLALVEAMMCGRASVVTDVGDNAVLAQEGVTGFVAPAPTVKLFDAALESAWEKRETWKALGVQAHQFAKGFIDLHPDKHLLENMIASIQ